MIPQRPFMFGGTGKSWQWFAETVLTEAPPFVKDENDSGILHSHLADAEAYLHSKIQSERDEAYSAPPVGEPVMPNFNRKGWINYLHEEICKILKPLYADGTLVKRYNSLSDDIIEDAQWIEKSVNLLEKK